jgi:hypothetical protein
MDTYLTFFTAEDAESRREREHKTHVFLCVALRPLR